MAKRERLGDILIKAGLLDSSGLQRALEEQEQWGGPLGHHLVQLELISEETLVRALSTQFKLPAVALDGPRLDPTVARRIPREICERNRLICFRADSEKAFLDVAMADPASLDAVDEVRLSTRCNVRPFFASPSAIDRAIRIIFYGERQAPGESAIDLSPQSPMRTDPHARRARRNTGPRQEPPVPHGAQGSSLPPTMPSAVSLREGGNGLPEPARQRTGDVELPRAVAPVAVPPAISLPGAGDIALPPSGSTPQGDVKSPGTDEFLHISMEIDEVGAGAAAKLDGEELQRRVRRLERTVARNSMLIQLLLGVLVESGSISPERVAKMLKDL